jgi:dTDP-4-dehydrorhamnose 3,5-epimerase
MKIQSLALPDVFLIQPTVYGDERGYFTETYRHSALQQATGLQLDFIQDNESRSKFGVLRGLHYQLPPFAQSKLIRVTEGRIWDVAVDIRQGSPTYGQYAAAELSADNKHQLFVPRGFAHGFVVLSEYATVTYKVDNYYSPGHDRGLRFNDPVLNITWPIAADLLCLSDKDKQQPDLQNIATAFMYGQPLYD